MSTKKQLLKQSIINQIRAGELIPGSLLNEQALGEEFGLSATPIREVILTLENDGLLEKRSRGGVRVKEYDVEQLLGMVELHAELEGLAAKYAAKRITLKQGKHLEQTVIACEQFVDALSDKRYTDDYYSLNLDFHMALFDACGNQILVREVMKVGTGLIPYFRARHRLRDSLTRSAIEHRQVFEAVLDGNQSLAQERMFQHVMLTNDIALDVLNSLRN